MRILRINKGKTFPLASRLVNIALTIVGIIKILQLVEAPYSLLLTILLSLVPPAIWFATNIIIINAEENKVFDGIWVMGYKIGQSTPYDSIEQFEVEKKSIKKTLFTLPNNQNLLTNHEYRLHLRVSPENRYYLLSHPLEETINKKIRKMKEKLLEG